MWWWTPATKATPSNRACRACTAKRWKPRAAATSTPPCAPLVARRCRRWASTLWLIPGHCDPTVNLHDWMIGVRGGLQAGTVAELIRVDARGCLD